MKTIITILLTLLMLIVLFPIVLTSISCDSDSPVNAKLYFKDETEDIQDNLGTFIVNQSLQINVVFYDKCNNITTNINNEKIIVFEPVNKSKKGISYNSKLYNESNKILLDLNSNLAGEFKLTVFKTYKITFEPGEASEKNSIIEVDQDVIALGKSLIIYIIPYDEFNNLIDVTKYNGKCPFDISYNDQISDGNCNIVNIGKYQIMTYELRFYEEGVINISVKAGNNLISNNCVTAKSIEISLEKSSIHKFYNNELEDLKKNTILNTNTNEKPTIRIFPKDKDGKEIEFISKKQYENLTSYLVYYSHKKAVYNLTLKNENYTNDKFLEFVFNDIDSRISVSSLPKGEYYLNINNSYEHLSFKISLDNGCGDSKYPFRCNVKGESQCVNSQTKCDCPKGYSKCCYMSYCVPDKKMCLDYLTEDNNDCWGMNQNYKARKNPNQKVCPVGKVLCADFSCRDSYDQCLTFHSCGIKERCPDQTCINNIDNCPNTLACKNSEQVVCNNNKCADSELDCEESVVCDTEPNTYLCDGNFCSTSWTECDNKKNCGFSKLCEDDSCKNKCN